LDSFEVRSVVNAYEAHRQRDDQERNAQKKRAQRGYRQSEPGFNAAEFESSQETEVLCPGSRGDCIRAVTVGAANMTKRSADHKLGSATPTRLG
jgi:hypothetical protein